MRTVSGDTRARTAPDDATPAAPATGAVRRPPWLRIRLADGAQVARVGKMLEGLRLNTVCAEARCPNLHECWSHGTATFMILGEVCTRACRYCAVTSGRPAHPDSEEPAHVAEAVRSMGIRHAVVTSVDRDDLPDGGAGHFARVVAAIRGTNPGTKIEVLVPDFNGDPEALRVVMESRPEILNHNIETVPRLYRTMRPRAGYRQSLELLRRAAEWKKHDSVRTKSGLMLGLGETGPEIESVLRDLREADCDILTLGQYLQPTPDHAPVARFVHPDEFLEWKRAGLAMGFLHVESGPLVRSSYHAHEQVAGL
jgi:lipoic acid synthetase